MGERPLKERPQFDPQALAVEAENKKPPSVGLFLAGAAVVLLLASIFKPMTPEQEEKATARLSIEMCWEEQERKSLTPQQARFVAAACEMMEDDFRKKYGVRP